mgnify:CR=1 FL=1|tara:strand:+ start:775 stop:1014 length:240 start_codon:yes stop_codon:yes gene_type:complete
MAERIAKSTLETLRDNLITAYTAISTSPSESYTLGDRTFTYAERADLWAEIEKLERLILIRSTTYKAKGKNRVDFEKWN